MTGEEVMAHIRSAIEQIGVKTLYGEPITAGERTIVPVARILYGFGGGMGKGEKTERPEGGGGGMGYFGMPTGYIEMSSSGTRYVALGQRRQMAAALLAGLVLGFLAGLLRRR